VFGQAILDKVSHAHVDGLISSTGDLNSLYTIIVQKGVDVAPLENKVEGLINQACNIKLSKRAALVEQLLKSKTAIA